VGAGAEARLQRAGLEAHSQRPASGGGGSSPAAGEQGRPDEASVCSFAGGGVAAQSVVIGARASRTGTLFLLGWAVSNTLIRIQKRTQISGK